MSKLRKDLRLYYLDAGKNDAIVFRLPDHGFNIEIETRKGNTSDSMVPHEKVLRHIESGQIVQVAPDEQVTSRAFDEFFGDGASSAHHQGVIVVQSDAIPGFLEKFVPNLRELIESDPQHRFFKARTWVNRWDTDGANAIRDEFLSHGMRAPRLTFSDHAAKDLHTHAPFEITMGLGFTDRTTKVFQSCREWLHVKKWADCGTALSLHEWLVDDGNKRFYKAKDNDPNDLGFRRLLPKDWSESYIGSWITMMENPDSADVRDYAVILRHTQQKANRNRKVVFALGGFTERSTAIAGRYLAKNWFELWTRYVEGEACDGSLGDFLIVIEGPSSPESVHEWWSEDKSLSITPQLLYERGIRCEWSNRIEDQVGQPIVGG
jgi:hypothetical protein